MLKSKPTRSKWFLGNHNGSGTQVASDKRLTYTVKLDATKLSGQDVVLVTCAEGYQWAMKVGTDGSSFVSNNYWFNSGTAIRFSSCGQTPANNPALNTAKSYDITFRKCNTNNGALDDSNTQTITLADAAIISPKIYTSKA